MNEFSDAINILKSVGDLFGSSNKPNPNDWKGWDALDDQYGSPHGTAPASWVLQDGDSVPNEAGNILNYIKNVNNGLENVVKAIMSMGMLSEKEALDRLYLKLNRGGFANEANTLKKAIESGKIDAVKTPKDTKKPPIDKNRPTQPDKKKPNYWLIGGLSALGLVLLGTTIYLLARKK